VPEPGTVAGVFTPVTRTYCSDIRTVRYTVAFILDPPISIGRVVEKESHCATVPGAFASSSQNLRRCKTCFDCHALDEDGL
jgi:hypothetical protein